MFGCSLECLGNSPVLKIWTIQCQVSEYFLEGFLFWGLRIQEGFPDGSVGKNLPAMQEAKENPSNMGLMPGVRKISWRRKWQPTPVLLPGKSHGQKSLPGYVQSMELQRVEYS